ncbi:MAG: DUF433 domain-containing protein [Planctomycetes bacterium]|nr:DUF433 domain-containing protein [Planctomycetota bacterium]
MKLLGHGIYTFPEAARLVGLRTERIREWFRSRPSRAAVFHADYEAVDGDTAISFHDLVDVFVAGQLREHGVPLQTLRKVYATLQRAFDVRHAFCRKELLTDGREVFYAGLDSAGREEIIEVLTRQRVFPKVIKPFLKRIDYAEATSLAVRWRIDDAIVIDPEICFGKPIVESAGISTAVLGAAYEANDRDAGLVADWYNVHPDEVLAAVRFESRLAG